MPSIRGRRASATTGAAPSVMKAISISQPWPNRVRSRSPRTDGRSDERNDCPETVAASKIRASTAATASTPHAAGRSTANRRRNVTGGLSAEPAARSCAVPPCGAVARSDGAHTHARAHTAPTSNTKAVNQVNRTSPNSQTSVCCGPVGPFTGSAEMADGAPT